MVTMHFRSNYFKGCNFRNVDDNTADLNELCVQMLGAAINIRECEWLEFIGYDGESDEFSKTRGFMFNPENGRSLHSMCSYPFA
jgi:hypothetical protein